MAVQLICLLVFLISSHSASDVLYAASLSDITDKAIDQSEFTVEGKNVNLQVSYGLNGEVRYGRTMLVTVNVIGAKVSFEGEVQVVAINQDATNISYYKDVNVTKSESSIVQIAVPINSYTNGMKVSLYNKNQLEAEALCELNPVNYGNYEMIGVLSDYYTSDINLPYMNSFGNKVIYLDENSFPSDYSGLDILDIIVIDRFTVDRLSTKQLEALLSFVKEGRTLVIATGQYVNETLLPFEKLGVLHIMEPSIHITTKDIAFVDNIEFKQVLNQITSYESARISLNAQNKATEYAKCYVGSSILKGTLLSKLQQNSIEKKIANVTVENSRVLVWEDGMQLMQSISFGKGVIQVLQFSLSTPIFEKEQVDVCTVSVVSKILQHQPINYKDKLSEEMYGYNNNYLAFDALSYSEVNKLSSILKYLVIILIYILCVGPMLFFVIKKIKKEHTLWIMVPSISLLFFFIIFQLGSATRIEKPYIGYANIATYDDEENVVNGELYIAAHIPVRGDSNITIEGKEIVQVGTNSFPYYENYNADDTRLTGNDDIYGNEYSSSVKYKENETVLGIKDGIAFSKTYVSTVYQKEYDEIANGYIHISENQVTGYVKNVTEEELEDAFVYCNGYLVSIGTIKQGEQVTLDHKKTNYLTNREMIYFSELVDNIANEDGIDSADNYRKELMMQYGLNKLYHATNKAYILAFKEETNIPKVSILANNKGSYGTTLVMIPIQVSYEDGDRVFVPYDEMLVTVLEGDYQKDTSRYLLSDTAIVKYELPRDAVISEILYSGFINRKELKDYIPQFVGEIYLYNLKSKQYDLFYETYGLGLVDTSINIEETTMNIKENQNNNSSLKSLEEDKMSEGQTNEDDTNREVKYGVKRITSDKLKNYLTPDNSFIIKVKTNNADIVYSQILPYISYYKKQSTDVNN